MKASEEKEKKIGGVEEKQRKKVREKERDR